MIKLFFPLILVSLISTHSIAQDKFADAAGKPGSTAIGMDSSVFIAWATGVEVSRGYINISDKNAQYNGSIRASFGIPENALGKAEGNPNDVVSLGDSGIATLTFRNPIKNGPGYDFAVFENSFSDNFLELAFVEVSSDGVNFYRFPSVSLTPTKSQVGSFGSLNPVNIHNLAGKYRMGYGTPFDLDDLKNEMSDLNQITHVRIIDAIGSISFSSSRDSHGNIVNDLFPTPFHNGGFDLDAVGVIHENLVSGNTDLSESSAFSIYPNPSSGKVYLKGMDHFESIGFEIVDVFGKTLLSGLSENGYLFSPKEQALIAGNYLVKIKSADKTHIYRITIE